MVQCHAGESCSRNGHELHVAIVHHLAADTVGERHAEVEAECAQRGVEAAVEVGQGSAAVVEVDVLGYLRRVVGRGEVAVVVVDIPQRLSVVAHTCILTESPCVHWQSFAVEVAAAGVACVSVEHVVFVVVVEFQHLVLVCREVCPDGPSEVLGDNGVAVEFNLHSLVCHVAHVRRVASVAERERHLDSTEHVGGLAVEILNATAQSAVEHLELEACVDVGHSLPGDVFVTHLLQCESDVVALTFVNIICVGVEEVGDVVVSVLSERSLQLQFVEPLHVLHPLLLGHYPCASEGVEVTPAVVGMEARRGVAAVGELSEIFPVVVVESAEEPSLGVVAEAVGSVFKNGCRSVQFLVFEIGVHVLSVAVNVVHVVVVALVSCEQRNVVLSEFLVVFQQLLEVECVFIV